MRLRSVRWRVGLRPRDALQAVLGFDPLSWRHGSSSTSPGDPGAWAAPARARAGVLSVLPDVAPIVIFAAVYFGAAKLGLSLAATHKNVSLVWPPTGIALAALLFFGYRIWPGVTLGALLVNASTDVSLATAGGIAAGNTLEALSGACLLQRLGFRHSIERVQDVLALVALAAVLSTTVSATVGVASLCLGGSAPWAAYGSLWWQWWLGDAMGDLVVAPALLVWGSQPRMMPWHPGQAAEAGAVLVLLITASQVVFGGRFTTDTTNFPLAFATFPLVIWAALRFGQHGATTATLVVSGAAISSTVRKVGPFLGKTPTESLVLVQIFMSVVALTALVLAAAITQRRRGEERFRLAVEAAPNAMIMVDAQGTILLVNAQTEKLFGYTREELLGLEIDRLVPERFRGRHLQYRANFFADVRTRAMGAGRDLFALRQDGSEIPVEIGLNPIKTDGGTFVLAAIIDISERKQAEAALEHANKTLTGWVTELEERNRQITLLSEMGDLLQSCRTVEEACTVITQFAQQFFPGQAGVLGVLRASKDLVEPVAVWGDPPRSAHTFALEDCWALRRGRMHVVEAFGPGLVCRHAATSGSPGSLCVPMMAQGEPLGVLHLRRRAGGTRSPDGSREHREESQRRLAVTVAEHIALALANLRAQETLRSQAIHDPLTGLFNRRYMEESLEREVRRAHRAKASLGIIIADIDHFKRFNDTLGHEAGDALLEALGRFLRAHVRAEDIACRYGGEEFLLILPDALPETARERAEQLREGVAHLHVPYQGDPLEAVTLSLGVATFPDDGPSGQAVVLAADGALYRAKHEGRNRVAVAPRPGAPLRKPFA